MVSEEKLFIHTELWGGGKEEIPTGSPDPGFGVVLSHPLHPVGWFWVGAVSGRDMALSLVPSSLFFVPSDGLFPFLRALRWVIPFSLCPPMGYSLFFLSLDELFPFFSVPLDELFPFFRASAPRPHQDPALLHEAFVTRAQGPFETRPRCPGERGSCLAVPIFPQWCLFSLESEGVCALCPAPAPGAKPDLCCSLSAPRKEGKKKGDFCVENNL